MTEPRSPSLTVLRVDLVCDQLWLQGGVAGGPPWAPPAQCSALIVFRVFTAFEQRVLHSHFAPALQITEPVLPWTTEFFMEKNSLFSEAEYQVSSKQILRNGRSSQSSLFTLKYINSLVGIFPYLAFELYTACVSMTEVAQFSSFQLLSRV